MQVKIICDILKLTVLHGVLHTLDPKPMRGAEPVVRRLPEH